GGCHFLAVNAKTGEIIWHFNGLSEENKKKYGFKDEPGYRYYFEMTPVIYKDMVIADTYGAGVFAFDIKTGKIIWWIEGVSGGTHRGDMLIRDGVVYELGSWCASAIKAETGEVIWDRNIMFGGDESSPCMGNGKLYMGESAFVGAVDIVDIDYKIAKTSIKKQVEEEYGLSRLSKIETKVYIYLSESGELA
ncbi:MAG: PQQ-binding-like beta-propeller repeat protein, partial [Thermotogae bacterium]|nr:PQQ-binding-like beta-propeller repeat protein [Thermotogota bacterium]